MLCKSTRELQFPFSICAIFQKRYRKECNSWKEFRIGFMDRKFCEKKLIYMYIVYSYSRNILNRFGSFHSKFNSSNPIWFVQLFSSGSLAHTSFSSFDIFYFVFYIHFGGCVFELGWSGGRCLLLAMSPSYR